MGQTTPAPRALWIVTIVVFVVFTVGRVAMAATLDLRTDEAYYWTWSQEYVLSYLDHPPMVAWFVRIGSMIFGDTPFGARAAHLVAMSLIELTFADIARRRTGSMSAALLVVLALESTLNFGVTSAFIEPSIPLVLFSGLMFWTLCRIEETGDGRWWLALGAFAGFALLSKYTVIFWAPAFAAYVLVPAQNRRWLRSSWFWGAGLLALLIFAPVLWWNWANDWASFRFQAVRAGATPGINWNTSSTYFLVNLVFNGPALAIVTVWGAVAALWRFRSGSEPIGLAIAVAFLAPFAYLTERSLYLYANPSWLIQMWPFGFVALAIYVYSPLGPAHKRLPQFAYGGIFVGLIIPAGMLGHALLDRSVWIGNRDPYGADAGFDVAAEQVLALAEENGASWVGTSTYHIYGVLRWQLRGRMQVVQLTERSRFIGWTRPDSAELAGTPGLYVFRDNPDPLVQQMVGTGGTPLDDVERIWRGTPIGSFHAWLVEGWTGPLDPPRDSPLYRWPSLV